MRRTGVLLIVAGVALSACGSSNSDNGGNGGSSAANTYCDQYSKLACNPYSTTAECLQVFNKATSLAAQAGCTAEWNAAVDCIESHPNTCSSGAVSTDPGCKTAIESYLGCDPDAECSSSDTTPTGGADTACTGYCGGSSVSCQITGGTASCTCTAGAHPGATYTNTDLNPCQFTDIYIHCD